MTITNGSKSPNSVSNISMNEGSRKFASAPWLINNTQPATLYLDSFHIHRGTKWLAFVQIPDTNNVMLFCSFGANIYFDF